MDNEKVVTGLDLGTDRVCVTIGRSNEYQDIEILGVGTAASEGMEFGAVSNIHKTVLAIRQAVKQAEKQAGVPIQRVNLGISGQHLKGILRRGSVMRRSPDDEMTVEEVGQLTQDMHNIPLPAGYQIIHIIPQSYTVDEKTTQDPVGMLGGCLEAEFYIIIAQTQEVNKMTRCVAQSGLHVDQLMAHPLAAGMAILSQEEKEAGVCLMDIGAGTTDIAVFYGGILRYVWVMPLGGGLVTNDIADFFHIPYPQAEKLKTKFGSALDDMVGNNEMVTVPGLQGRPPKEASVKMLANTIESRMKQIIELAHDRLIVSGYEEKLNLGGIFVTGGSAQMRAIQQLCEFITGLDTRIGMPTPHLGKSKVDVSHPMFAVCVGLTLAGCQRLEHSTQKAFSEKIVASKNIGIWNQLKGIKEGMKNYLTGDID